MGAKIQNDYKNKDILSLDQFDASSISQLFNTTDKLIAKIKAGGNLDILTGRVVTLLFFEPSSRTFGSFMSAVKRLGGQTIDIQDPLKTGSFVKGESLEDSVKAYEAYSDALIIRHPEVGSVGRAAEVAQIPVINAGDGSGEHPTQALYDLYTIYQKFNTLEGLKFVVGRDPLHSRTIRTFLKALALYSNNTVYLLSTKDLRLPNEDLKELKNKGLAIYNIDNEKDIPNDAHVWYWNRIQKERFKSGSESEITKSKFILTKKLLQEKGNNNLIILDPLPRVEEIDTVVDSDQRALYLTTQLKNGIYVRMALLSLVLGKL